MKPLDGARLKIVRAQKHLDCLRDEIRAYLEKNPYKFPLQISSRVIATGSAHAAFEPPLEFGCIFGDCLNNLRTSLDYIAWELAMKHAPASGLAIRESAIGFPIHKDRAAFDSNGGAKLKKLSIPTPAIDLIESVQPYNTGHEPLGLLNELVNRDKHRLPLLAIAHVETNKIAVTIDGAITLTIGFSDTLDGPLAAPVDLDSAEGIAIRKTIDRVTREASSPGDPSQQPPNVKVDGDASVFVTLKDSPVPPEPVDITLANIFKCISDIVPRFDPFFV
ncbi:MAG TPA: hypothetical protein VGJ26_06360 [Pirellulales bacterium]|jgi:hypothetical protein